MQKTKIAVLGLALALGASHASSQRMTESELKEMTATIINLNGHLCARVTDIRPLAQSGVFEVTCVEYRGGAGTVRYIMDAQKGTAFKAG